MALGNDDGDVFYCKIKRRRDMKGIPGTLRGFGK